MWRQTRRRKVGRNLPASAGRALQLGCNNITAGGACRIADQLRASPQVVTGVWLKRNPLGGGGGRAAAELVESARSLRTLDLVQTGLDAAGTAVLAEALLAAAGNGRRIERLFVGGNPLGEAGSVALAAVLAAGAIDELYVSAAGLGDAGAQHLAHALERAPYGRLARLSVASNGIGPRAAARLVAAATTAGVTLLDLGRVRAAAVLGAADNHIDMPAAETIAEALAGTTHRLTHLVTRRPPCGEDSTPPPHRRSSPEQSPAVNGQPGITVGHEDLRAVKTRHLHHTGGLRHDQARPVSTTLVINTPSV
ncbi:hypothetical protein [Streptomyces sp. A30]|uniref:hypothetical protein n=1 Tax=Streptomyces sp. A30 TaxID=2789273 RepID=UPI003980610B